MASEQSIQQHIRLTCSTGATRLFRNNTGTLRDQHGRPVFTSIEVKTPTGRLRSEQKLWLEKVQASGGIAGVARSVEDALRITTADG